MQILPYSRTVPTIAPRAVLMPAALKTEIIKKALAVKKIVRPALHDQFVIYDDGSALCIGMNGNDYAIDLGGRCSCPAAGHCRHEHKLTALIATTKRMSAAEPNAAVQSHKIGNDKCDGCGLYPVTLLLWGQYAGSVFTGYRLFHCCGCGDKRGEL